MLQYTDDVAPKRTNLPADGSSLKTSDALDEAESFLGKGYKEVDNGVYRSADGTRQVRMTDSDLTGHGGGAPHMNFEQGKTVVKPNGKESFKVSKGGNSHVFLPEETP